MAFLDTILFITFNPDGYPSGFFSLPHSPETRMNKSSTNSMKDNIMRVPDDLRNKNLSEESLLLKYLL